MAFISEKKRESLIKKINKSYGFRKFLMVFEMLLLIGFIVVTMLIFFGKIDIAQIYTKANDKITIQPLGWGLFAWAIAMVIFGLIALILILTLKSPKQITKEVSHLESSARSGKRNQKNSAENYRDRTKSKKEKK